jgi:hypothetical protein
LGVSRGVTKSVTLPVKMLGEIADPLGQRAHRLRDLDQGGIVLGEDVRVAINLEAVRSAARAD